MCAPLFVQVNPGFVPYPACKRLPIQENRSMKKFLIHTLVILTAIFVFRTASVSAQIAPTNIEVTASPKQSSVGRIGVTLSGVELEDAFQRQSKSRGLNPAVFREELVGALKELHPGTIRMEFPDLGQQLAGELSISGAAVNGASVSSSRYGLGEFLQLCVEAGSDPWLRIPSGTTPEQMRELVQYLSGTGSDAWTAARVAGGQSDPWTQVFGKIHVELSNENGSAAAASEYMEAGAYAERANADFGAARQVAGFDGSKFDLMLSGAGVSAQWAAAALAQSREQNSVAITADLPWRAAGAKQSELFGALLAEPEAMDSTGGILSREVTGLAMTTSTSASGTSVNVARSQLSLAAGVSEQLAQSWGASLAQAEHVLQMMAMGVRHQNGAVLTESNLHCVSASQTVNCRGAQLLTAALANGAIGSTMLQTVQTGANPSWSQIVSGEQVQAHALQSFAFTEGGKVSLVVFNLSRTSELPLTMSGANAPAGDVQLAQIAPREITASNESGAELQPSTQTLSASDVSGGLSLPPFSMTVLSWEAGSGVQTAWSVVSGTAKLASTTEKLTVAKTLTAQSAASASTTSSQTPVINCPSGFASSGSCGVSLIGAGGQPFGFYGTTGSWPPSLSGTQAILAQTGASHTAISLNYQTPVDVQAFTTTFSFIPNGQYLALVFNNSNNNQYFNGSSFSSGAGNEGGFYQAYQAAPPNNVFAMEFDGYNSLVINGTVFTHNSVQLYQTGQCPQSLYTDGCGGTYYANYSLTKLSTAPVATNLAVAPSGGCLLPLDPLCVNTTTGDTYSATATYDGYVFTLSFYDVTAGGSCPGASCYTNTWTGVNIPGIVGSTTAWVGFTQSTSTLVPTAPLYVNSWTYTVNTPASSHSFTPTNYVASACTTACTPKPLLAAPSFSPEAGTYTGTQSVALSSSANSVICYAVGAGSTLPAILPQPNNVGGCNSGTLYTGPVSVASTSTIYASAGPTAAALVYPSTTIGIPSTVVAATYTFGAGPSQAAAPTFSPAAGTYTGPQTVTISDSTAGATIYYTTDGTTPTTSSTVYSGPIMVSATETVEAMAVSTVSAASVKASVKANAAATGGTSSPIAAAAYTIDSVLPMPTFNIAAGTYTAAQTISISDATAGTTIYYTTNGTTPTTSSTKYSGAITVSATETLEAIAVASGHTNSAAASATYTINTTTTANPTGGTTYINNPNGGFSATAFHLNGGATVTSGKVVQLTNGGADEARSAWFSSQLPVQKFTTDFTFQQLNATADGMTFTIQGQGSTALGTAGGSLGYAGITKSVAVKFDLWSNAGEGTDSTGLYTDGAQPMMPAVDLTSTRIVLRSGDVMHAHIVYDGTNLTLTLTDTVTNATATEVFPVNIPSLVGGNMAYVGFTGGTGGATATQNVLSWTYVVPSEQAAATPTYSVTAGTYTTAQTVSISDATAGATIYYTTNGTTPTTSSTKYTGALTLSASETLEAIAVKTGVTNYPVATATYTIAPVLPVPAFSVAAGTYTSALSVTISDVTADTTIYYTTNGTTPTSSSAKYTEAIKVSATEKLQAIAIETGHTNSPVASVTYTIETALPAPAFSVAAGTYTSALSVAISDVTAGTTIYYTTNGTTPTTSSAKYTGAIKVSATEKLQAIAIETGHTNSPVASVAYTIETALTAPTFSQAAGIYTGSQSVTMSDATAGTTIYYTTNGTTPTTSSAKYTEAIKVSATEKLEAIAVETGHTESPVAAVAYTITAPKAALTVFPSTESTVTK